MPISSLKKLPSILGGDQSLDRLKGRLFEQKRHIEVPELKRLAPDMTLIKGAICKYYGIEEAELYHTKKAVYNEARTMGLYLSRYLRGEPLKIIGEQFKIDNYMQGHTYVTPIIAGNLIDSYQK